MIERVQTLVSLLQGHSAVGLAQMREPAATVSGISCSLADFAGLSAEILGSGKALRFQARGDSMSPLVRDGDVLLVRPVHPSAVRVGDLVLCSSERGRVVVHRVIRREVNQEGYWFKVQGDAVARPDGLIGGAHVYGQVVAVERNAEHIDLDRPVTRTLGWLAALRSRWGLGHVPGFRLVTRLVKRLPVFSKHMA